MNSSELSHSLPEIKPTPLETIKSLQEECIIPDHSPFWWGTDYQPDPRKYLPYEEFSQKLVKIDRMIGDPYYLYPEPEVPITTIELPIFGQKLNFMVTARPFHPKEINSDPPEILLREFKSASLLQKYVQEHNDSLFNFSQGEIQENCNEPLGHFKPHIRGLLASVRGNNFFWYPINLFSLSTDQTRDQFNFALQERNLSYLGIFQTGYGGDHLTYKDIWEELISLPNIFCTKKLSMPELHSINPNKPREVQAEEFISGYTRSNLSLLYPIRIHGINHTLPLRIRNVRFGNDEIKALICGIKSNVVDHCGIIKITDPEIAKQISQEISQDFGIPVETLLYVPHPGKSTYQRVSLEKIQEI